MLLHVNGSPSPVLSPILSQTFPHHLKLSPDFVWAMGTGDNRWAPDHGCVWDVSMNIGTFAKLRKKTISFVVCLSSARMEKLCSQWTNFHEIWYLRIFQKSLPKIQVLLKFYKNNGYSPWSPICIYGNISLNSSWNEKFLRKKKVVEKIKTHILSSTFFFLRKYEVYEIMLKNIVQRNMLQMTLQYGACTYIPYNSRYTHIQNMQ